MSAFPMIAPGEAPLVRGHRLTVALIQATVAEHYGIPLIEMTSDRRSWAVSHPRQLAMYLTKELTPKSLPDIGRRFGGRDHSTVIHAVRSVAARILSDGDTAHAAELLRERLAR